MARINGINMPNFTHKEIPEDVAPLIDKRALINIQKYRNILNYPFSISLDKEALVRYNGRHSSEHRVLFHPTTGGAIKLSTAIDGFPKCDIFTAWTKALSSNLYNGIGVYFDTNGNDGKPEPMLHIDLRINPLIWFRNEGKYMYPHQKGFYKKLMGLFLNHT